MLEKLRNLTVKNLLNLSYINLDKNKCYGGWVRNFHITYLPTNNVISLDLTKEPDLFLLFVLASAWSRSGPWENALFFTAYLKINYDIQKVLTREIKIIPNKLLNDTLMRLTLKVIKRNSILKTPPDPAACTWISTLV